MNKNYSKRSFLKVSFAGILSAGILPTAMQAKINTKSLTGSIPQGLTFLFQGDSITDGNRGRNNDPNHIMGHGYAYGVASRVGADFPEAGFTFYNRGISGDKVYQLERRWQEDALDLKPDVLSILAGINDVGDMINDPAYPSIEPGFEGSFRNILRVSREQNPSLLIVLGLPFFYPVGHRAEKKELWLGYTEEKQASVRKLAKEFDAIVVDYPAMFNKIIGKPSMEYWIWDGVHPTVFGHELMARKWIKAVSERLDFLKIYANKLM